MKRLMLTFICALLLPIPVSFAQDYGKLIKSDKQSVKLIGFVDSDTGKYFNDKLVKSILEIKKIYGVDDVECLIIDKGQKDKYMKQLKGITNFRKINKKDTDNLKISYFPSIVIISPSGKSEVIIGHKEFPIIEAKIVDFLNNREKNKKKKAVVVSGEKASDSKKQSVALSVDQSESSTTKVYYTSYQKKQKHINDYYKKKREQFAKGNKKDAKGAK